MKNGDISNQTYSYIVFDAELMYQTRVPRWREVLGMGKTTYNHPFMRYLHNLARTGKPVTISMFCFKGELDRVEDLLQKYGLPVTRIFPIESYEELTNLPVIVERIVSNETSVLNRVDRSLDYNMCQGVYRW